MSAYDVNHDLSLLLEHIRRLGTANAATGLVEVKFKALFDDDEVANSLESLAGTLKAAKKKKKVAYGPELLLQGASDDVVITLCKEE